MLSCLTPRYNSNSPKKAQGITHNSRDERVLCIHITENSLSNLLLGANHKNTSFVPVSNSLTKKKKNNVIPKELLAENSAVAVCHYKF